MRAQTLLRCIVIASLVLCGCRSSSHCCGSDATVRSVPDHAAAYASLPVEVAAPASEEASAAAAMPESFDSPESAMRAVADMAESADDAHATRIFGRECHDVLQSDDEAADHEDCLRVAGMIRERLDFEDGADGTKMALVGKDRWRFPIPLARTERGWVFDLDAGRDELLGRQIGQNELLTVDSLDEYVRAQREYAAKSWDGKPHAFAAKFCSTEGRHDGLFWVCSAGETNSPLGPSLAGAEVCESRPAAADPVPFHGYYYTVLTAQGKSCPGGEASYLDQEGRLRRGCGALAWPEAYGQSGIMTFMVSHAGIVYEKDLGPATSEVARTITRFDPDDTWRVAQR